MIKNLIGALALSLTITGCATASVLPTSASAPAQAPAAASSQQNPLGNLLGGLKKGGNSDGGDATSGLGNVLGGLVSGLISKDKVEPQSLVGTWSYTGPAVSFKSDNFLQKAGGAAAAGVVEGKLAPYYQKFGLTNMVLTVNEDMSFKMQSGRLGASGTIEVAEDGGSVAFHFQVMGQINLGTMTAYITLTGSNQMSLMFDVTKLISLVKTVGSVTGSSAIQGVSSLLESYDGICAGFKLQRQ